jgi:hypothetical protein
MNTVNLENYADYGDVRLGQLRVDRDGLNSVNTTTPVNKMFDDYVKVVRSLVSKMRSGTADELKRCAEKAVTTKMMIKGKEPSIKKNEAVGEIFDKYTALIDELVAQIKISTSRNRSKTRNRTRSKRRPFRP